MHFLGNVIVLLGYFTPSRSPMFAVALTSTVALLAASGGNLPSLQDLLNDFPPDAKVYALADGNTVLWIMIVIPLMLVAAITVIISIRERVDIPTGPDFTQEDNDANWKNHLNLSRAFCLATPIFWLVMTVRALPESQGNSLSGYFFANYAACIAQICMFLLFMFAEFKAGAQHYNLIQFSLITSCFLAGASLANIAAAEVTVLRSEAQSALEASQQRVQKAQAPTEGINQNEGTAEDKGEKAKEELDAATASLASAQSLVDSNAKTNRQLWTMIMLYVLWFACMVFWAFYLNKMTRISVTFQKPSPNSSTHRGAETDGDYVD